MSTVMVMKKDRVAGKTILRPKPWSKLEENQRNEGGSIIRLCKHSLGSGLLHL